MPRGGKRSGAGRPKGSKEVEPRAGRKQLPVPSDLEIQEFTKFKKRFYLTIKPYLSLETKELYESLLDKENSSPLECMKMVLHDLMVRYKIGRIEELKANRTWEGLTKLVDAMRQVADLVARIEQESPTLQVNILNILTSDLYKEKAKELTKKIFTVDESMDAIFEDISSPFSTGIDFLTSIEGSTGVKE